MKQAIALVSLAVGFVLLLVAVVYLPPLIVATCTDRPASVTENDCVEAADFFAQLVRAVLVIPAIAVAIVLTWLVKRRVAHRGAIKLAEFSPD